MTLTFEMPNLGSARATYDSQARPCETDIAILSQGIGGSGVVTGCKVIPRSPTSMSVRVETGNILLYPTDYDIAQTDLTIAAAHSTLHRRDLIVADDTGFGSVVQGAVGQVNPLLGPLALPPALPDGQVGIGMVDVPPGATAITSAMILDKRAFVPPAAFGSTAWTIVAKNTDETRSNSATLTDDDDLHFPMAANTVYTIRGKIFGSITSISGAGFKWGLDGPASPVLVNGMLTQWILNATAYLPGQPQLVTAYPNSGGFTYTRWGTSGGASNGQIDFTMMVSNGSNTGTFRFTWSQVTATALQSATVYAGSFLEYIAI